MRLGFALCFVPLLAAACGRREAPPLPATPEAIRPVDDFEVAKKGALGREWYTGQPAYTVEVGQVSTRAGLKGTTLAVWRTEAPPDHFAEVKVGDLAGGTFADFRGLQVFVRLESLGGTERVSFQYSSDARRYEIRHEFGVGRILAQTGTLPPPALGEVMRLEARGDRYLGRVNGQAVLEAHGPRLDGRHAGFAVGIDIFTVGVPRRVVDAWSAGGVE